MSYNMQRTLHTQITRRLLCRDITIVLSLASGLIPLNVHSICIQIKKCLVLVVEQKLHNVNA